MFGVPLKNLVLFAVVNIVATAAVLAISFWLDAQFGFDGGSGGGWIPSFAAACIFAGYSYARDSGWAWTREDRRKLAMAYAAVAFVIGVLSTIAYLAFDDTAFALLGTLLGSFILVFVWLFQSLMSYGLARLLLGQVVRQNVRKTQ